jgi:hypothetical protein
VAHSKPPDSGHCKSTSRAKQKLQSFRKNDVAEAPIVVGRQQSLSLSDNPVGERQQRIA